MKKRISLILMLLVLFFSMAVPAFATGSTEDTDGFTDAYYRLQDQAGLLTAEEADEVQKLLDEVSVRLKFDFAIVTVNSLDGYTAQDYADDCYEYCEFGYGGNKDGALLLISMEDRDWAITTCGYGITAFTDAGITYIGEQMGDDLAAGNYAEAFHTFARFGNQFVTQAREGNPFDQSDLPKKPLSMIWIVISIVIGFGAAKIIVGSMKSQLKSVRTQAAANSYAREGSMKVTESRDLFLYNKIDRVEKSKNNSSGSSTHTSSSGTKHGGGGGKF